MKAYRPCPVQTHIDGLRIHHHMFGDCMQEVENALLSCGYDLLHQEATTVVFCPTEEVIEHIERAISARKARGYWSDKIPQNPGRRSKNEEKVAPSFTPFDCNNETICIVSRNVQGLEEAFNQGVSEWFSHEFYSEITTPTWWLESPTTAVIQFNFGGMREVDSENVRKFSRFMQAAIKQYQNGFSAPFKNG
jgi:hypothetical protein